MLCSLIASQESSVREQLYRSPRPERDQVDQRPKFLVVEDTRPICFLLTQFLRPIAERVDIACDGHQAVRKVIQAQQAGEPYDLVLMDLQMPVMSGLEATLAIRNRGIETPIVAMTAGVLDRDRCSEAGCDGMLAKPIDREHFLDYVGQFL